MDFWSKLIAGVAGAPLSSKAALNNPDKRLARFKREYNSLLQTWRGASNLTRDAEAVEILRKSLTQLTSILADESRRPSPHLCITFSAQKQIYIPIAKIATTSYNELIIREAVGLFSSLIDSEEEDFLESVTFAKSLMTLLSRVAGISGIGMSSEAEVEVVELMFGIAAKIRLQPEILPAWFNSDDCIDDNYELDQRQRFAGKTHKQDFPLFYLLIDYVHHEGRVGDFARTGLLYIIESASHDMALEQWIVESDLATLMASGLGALYSQLSRKLVIDYDQLPPILAFSDYESPATSIEAVTSSSLDYKGHMETFLSHLLFWQDVLDHCKSIEVKQTLLEHFQILFLQQLLYPSLLQSSDVDGGSSVAVLTYLRRILESLEHPDMIHLILHYLLALPDVSQVASNGARASISAARKRKSMDLKTMMASEENYDKPTPALFNLVDLILGSLRSRNHQTVTVTLQLLSVILRRHHRYATTTLLHTISLPRDRPQRTIGVYEKEMEFIFGLVSEITDDGDQIDSAYEDHLKDTVAMLESHPCSIPIISPKAGSTLSFSTKLPGAHASIPGAPRDVQLHTLRPDDPVLKTIINILESFFVNPVEMNLALTATIVDLAACGLMSIEGWLVSDPANYTVEDIPEEPENSTAESDPTKAAEERQLRAIKRARSAAGWSPSQIPALLQVLKILVTQVKTYRSEIPRFEDLLQQRRNAFQTTESLTANPGTIPANMSSSQSSRKEAQGRSSDSLSGPNDSPPRSGKTSALDSLAQRLFPELMEGSGSRSSSRSTNRGREKLGMSSSDTPTRQSGYRTPPPQFPMLNTDPSPSRGHSPRPRDGNRARVTSDVRVSSDSSNTSVPSSSTRGVPPSQAAAFAAIDQGILRRLVGIPSDPTIPLPSLRDSVREPPKSSPGAGVGGVDEDMASRTTSVSGLQEEIEEEKKVTVSHVLTNVLVLEGFLLELAALVQVRAGLFGEVGFGLGGGSGGASGMVSEHGGEMNLSLVGGEGVEWVYTSSPVSDKGVQFR